MKTAVEWLVEQLFGDNNGTFGVSDELLNKAKEMEKEQILDAYKHNSIIRTQSKAEQYYNETFKSE